MRIAARHWWLFGAVLIVLAPLLLLRAERDDFAFRTKRPAYKMSPVQTQPIQTQPVQRLGPTQQELLGINPHRLILYTPMPVAIPPR